jgi:hypothetical protein
MVLYYSLAANALAGVRADAYVALVGPRGLRWYAGDNRFSDRMAPLFRDVPIPVSIWGTAAWIRLDKTWAGGPYVWLGVLCKPETSPLDEGNWLSNLARAEFVLTK